MGKRLVVPLQKGSPKALNGVLFHPTFVDQVILGTHDFFRLRRARMIVRVRGNLVVSLDKSLNQFATRVGGWT